MRRLLTLLVPVAALAACGAQPAGPPHIQAATPEEAGRYFFLIGGCNDCHTVGWAESNGKLPEAEWALGNPMGNHGPWGTTYAPNLRLAVKEMDERKWVELFRKGEGSPPMPWQNYRAVPEADLIALHRFLTRLGPRGKQVPDMIPPGKPPVGPYIDFTPKQPPAR